MKIKKRNLLLVTSIIFVSCSHKQNTTDFKTFWDLSGAKSTLSNSQDESRWKTKNNQIIFNGNIVEGDCAKFKKTANRQHTALVVNSQGGSVSEAVCIANAMKELEINKTIVNGLCWSSCANYLFLGASDRVIKRGSVGFHGNTTALFNQDPTIKTIKKASRTNQLSNKELKLIREFFKSNNKNKNLSKQELNNINIFLTKTRETLELEKNFLKSNRISQKLFEVTQAPDKGNKDGGVYIFLIPSVQTFKEYGIKNIIGENSLEFVRMFNKKQKLKLLYK